MRETYRPELPVNARLSVDAAYEVCTRDAKAHYENFPVASFLLPRAMRRHVAAVYAFARSADDFADEGDRSVEERLQLLEAWGDRLRHAVLSEEAGAPPRTGEPAHAPAIFVALGASMRAKGLPVELFEDLLSAFRQDVTVARYATWADLYDYCRRSANPVGRLVLRIAGYREQQLDLWSDAICTALQLTNFWQDLEVDQARRRMYLPEEARVAHGTREAALRAAARRTRELFQEGRPLCDAVAGRLRYELRATWLGGVRILDQLERGGFKRQHRPTLRAVDAPWFVGRLLTWQRQGTRP